VASLVELGDSAFRRGELVSAEDRYQRALDAQPGAVRPRVGLARVALARDQTEEARRLAEEALAREPEQAEALFVLARVERASESPERARELLWRAVRIEPQHVRAHTELAELTGRAPRELPSDPRAVVQLADRYPYDPWATLQAARALVEAGEPTAAAKLLESHSWLAGIDPGPGLEGLALLAELDPRWARRRIVPVHCYADETVRLDPAWAMRMRMLFALASSSLGPVLDTVLLPVSVGPYRSGQTDRARRTARPSLAAIDAAFQKTAGPLPSNGIIAVFTERTPPPVRGTVRLGHAEYLGRRLVVRLQPDEVVSRTLLHEILHLYGGVHISDDVPSLMNAAGKETQLDRANLRIARTTRTRGFGQGSLERNLLDVVDPQELVQALLAALRLNLHFRRLGIQDALEARDTSRIQAGRQAREAAALDKHLGDVSNLIARLELYQGYEASAARYFEVAASLYGPNSRKGQLASESAERLWRRSEPGGR
jgi:tetratricopeptide (TPR) repeat protein